MWKINTVGLIGLAVLGLLILDPGQMFANDPPPTIRADLGPIKHRPEGYMAEQQWPRVTTISTRSDSPNAQGIDVYFRLPR